MLKTIRTYRKSLFGVLAIAAVTLVMTGFGINFVSAPDSNYAIKIDDIEIPFRDFERQRRAKEQQYRSMLGENFDRLGPRLLADMNEQLIDSEIANALIERQARNYEMFVSDERVAQFFESIMQPGWTADDYENILSRVGMSAPQFERQIATDALRDQFTQILEDASFLPERELKTMVRIEETKYDVEYLEIKPAAYTADVADPDDNLLLERYEENAYEYEAPAKVSYNYFELDRAAILDLVEVFDDDIELYYVDNENDFKVPAQIKASHIQINLPKDADQDTRQKTRALAEEAVAKAAAGEDFAELVREYSEDIETKASGGDLGWIGPGKMAREFDKAAFNLEPGQVSDLIETDYGFEIVKLEDIKPEHVKELSEVRDQIIKTMKEREAPAYAAAQADEYIAQLSSGSLSFEDLAKKVKAEIQKSPIALSERMDPRPTMRGLTKQVIENPDLQYQQAEVGDKTILVEITKYSEPAIQPFEEVKPKILRKYKQEQAAEIAKKTADETMQKFDEGVVSSLEDAAKLLKLETVKREDLTRRSAIGPIFSNAETKREIFNTNKSYNKPKKVVAIDSNYYLIVVNAVKEPSAQEIEQKLESLRVRSNQQSAGVLVASIINNLKSKAKIDIHESLLTHYSDEASS